MLSNKSVIDFLVMFGTNLIKKIIGFAKEVILASIFGSSLLYANFLLLRTASDLFAQLFNGNALQASLLSKFSKLYANYDMVSLSMVNNISKRIMLGLFIISQLVQLPIVWYINDPNNTYLFVFISIILGLILSISFYSSVFLIIMQGKGEFQKHSFATTIDMFMSTIFLYPFSYFFGVIGILFSRLIGFFTMIYKYLRPMFNAVEGQKAVLKIKDFSISIMLLGNFANIIILISRFVAGLGHDNNITFFNYSVVLLNALLTAVILNINTLVLAKLAIQKNLRLIFISFIIALLLGLSLVYLIDIYGFVAIQFVFQRGAFTLQDTVNTVAYAKDLSVSFIFIFIASSLFQPFFSLEQRLIKRQSNIMASIFVFSILLLLIFFQFSSFSSRESSLIMIYTLSIVSMLLSFFSVFKYLNIKSDI